MQKFNTVQLDGYGWVGSMELKKDFILPKYRSAIVDLTNYEKKETQRHDVSQPFFTGRLYDDYVKNSVGETIHQPVIESKGQIFDLVDVPDLQKSYKSVEKIPVGVMFENIKEVNFNAVKSGNVWKIERKEIGKLVYTDKKLSDVLGEIDTMLGIKEIWLPNCLNPVKF